MEACVFLGFSGLSFSTLPPEPVPPRVSPPLAPELPVPGIPFGYTSHSSIIPLGFLYAHPSLNASPGLCGQNQLLNCCIFNRNTCQFLACTNLTCIVFFSGS